MLADYLTSPALCCNAIDAMPFSASSHHLSLVCRPIDPLTTNQEKQNCECPLPCVRRDIFALLLSTKGHLPCCWPVLPASTRLFFFCACCVGQVVTRGSLPSPACTLTGDFYYRASPSPPRLFFYLTLNPSFTEQTRGTKSTLTTARHTVSPPPSCAIRAPSLLQGMLGSPAACFDRAVEAE